MAASSSSLNTVRVQNPAALRVPEIRDLLLRALEKSPWKGKGDAILGYLENLATSPSYSLRLSREDGKWVGISLTGLPETILDTTPQVIYLYNEGSIAARKSLVKATVDFIHASGYTTFWAVNHSGRGDKAWSRVMKTDGWGISPIGTLMEFKHE